MTTTARAELHAALEMFAEGQPLGMERIAAERTAALLAAYVAGRVDAAALRAIGGERHAPAAAPPGAGIRVIDLCGVLMPGDNLLTMLGIGRNVRAFMRELRAAGGDASVHTIVIHADSPGGSVGMIPEAAALVRTVAGIKRVLVAIGGMCCSAAFWTCSGASEIVATMSGRVGALGIITERVSFATQLERDGIAVEVIASSPAKSWGHPATRITDDERRHIQQDVGELKAQLLADVAVGRRVSVDVVRERFGDGRCLSAKRAIAAGLIDRIATTDETLERLLAAPALNERRAALAQVELSAARRSLTRALLAGPRAQLAASTRGHR